MSLLTLGLGLIIVAGLGLAQLLGTIGPMSATATCVGALTALLGLGVVISGLRGRHGGWMSGLGWLAAAICVPLIVFSAVVPQDLFKSGLSAGSTTITWSDIEPRLQEAPADGVLDLSSYTVGSVVLDLRDMPADALSTDRTVRVWVGTGDIDVLASAGQPVSVDASVGAGEVSVDVEEEWMLDGVSLSAPKRGHTWQGDEMRLDGEPVSHHNATRNGLEVKARLSSPAAAQAPGTLVVRTEVGAGAITVTQAVTEVTWRGNAEEEVWIVDSWTSTSGWDEDAVAGSPVPGMVHPAISDDTAETCLTNAGVDDDAAEIDPNDFLPQGYGVLPLTQAQRASYDACVAQALADGRGVSQSPATTQPTDAGTGATTSPSASAGSTPSPQPSTAPSPAATN